MAEITITITIEGDPAPSQIEKIKSEDVYLFKAFDELPSWVHAYVIHFNEQVDEVFEMAIRHGSFTLRMTR